MADEAPAEPKPEEAPTEPPQPPPEEPPKAQSEPEPVKEDAETKPPEIKTAKSKEIHKIESGKLEKVPSEKKASLGSKSKEESVPGKKLSGHLDEQRSTGIISAGSVDSKKRSRDLSKEDSRKIRMDRVAKTRSGVSSTISIHRLSFTGDPYDKKCCNRYTLRMTSTPVVTEGARFMNTYKLEADNPFNPEKVRKVLESVMVEALENLTYDPDKCPKQAKWASSAIRSKVKELQFDRYKLICLVTIGEKNSQDVMVTCRFLWDVDRDRYATFSMENTYVFGIAQCFGIYYE